MTLLNIPEGYITSISDDEIAYDFGLTVFLGPDKVRFDISGTSTAWLSPNDEFIERIQFERLNPCFISEHLAKEIEVKRLLDEGLRHLDAGRYPKAISCFDEAICYDDEYGSALLSKSRALFGQRHFVKALRHYKRALKANGNLADIDYHKSLIRNANDERSAFPKIKMHIYMGDEHFASGDFKGAVESYDKALADPSRFKSKILYKLLNKKATALFEMEVFSEALDCFGKSLEVQKSDYAIYMSGYCRCRMGLDLDDSFLEGLKITKRQRLCRARILIEYRMHEDAIKCIDDLLSVHFTPDELYLKALSSKVFAMDLLGMDVQAEKEILNKVRRRQS